MSANVSFGCVTLLQIFTNNVVWLSKPLTYGLMIFQCHQKDCPSPRHSPIAAHLKSILQDCVGRTVWGAQDWNSKGCCGPGVKCLGRNLGQRLYNDCLTCGCLFLPMGEILWHLFTHRRVWQFGKNTHFSFCVPMSHTGLLVREIFLLWYWANRFWKWASLPFISVSLSLSASQAASHENTEKNLVNGCATGLRSSPKS